ncbi:uncharacterized protein K460DRAFT_56903 [Cucurbitaria berberidis CBS 394.84]|uniref:Uncharacterized protein n=1 Tax=Cucurbitaria berberidis CBS 394.84 TaxID=1168544 RepID=A0A9P4GLL6_9PLEO|nr:uncharacterized protein K460DRAFT_56903 [Cucurbitaria berberidis CBS 394.84]KAF1847331.1 hypothetical protein K460DRAFT_56903 [Cucurbitaria berberidis CBS 394.84]
MWIEREDDDTQEYTKCYICGPSSCEESQHAEHEDKAYHKKLIICSSFVQFSVYTTKLDTNPTYPSHHHWYRPGYSKPITTPRPSSCPYTHERNATSQSVPSIDTKMRHRHDETKQKKGGKNSCFGPITTLPKAAAPCLYV